jgi:hypothetical protein
MMRCPDCLDAMVNGDYAAPLNGLPCCLARDLAGTPVVRQKTVGKLLEQAYPNDWPAIRAEAVRIIEARKAQRPA